MQAILSSENQTYQDEKKETHALITFPMNMSVFKKEAGELKRIPNEYVLRNTTHEVVSIENGVAELSDGRFVKDIYHNKPKIHFGKIEVNGSKVPVYSCNGVFLRYLTKGQVLNVISTFKIDSNLFFVINEREIISSLEYGIKYVPV